MNDITLSLVFDVCYVIKEEEISILLERAQELVKLRLKLSELQLSDQFLYMQAFNPRMQSLVALNLSRAYLIRDEAMCQFLKNPKLFNLAHLNISYTQLTDEVMQELAFSENIRALETLDVSFCLLISENGVGSFAASNNSHFLRTLNISGLEMSDVVVASLLDQKSLESLEEVIINECPRLSHQVFQYLAKPASAKGARQLRSLSLSTCFQMAMSSSKDPVKRIKVFFDNKEDNLQFSAFANSPNFTKLVALNLSNNQLSDKDVAALGKSKTIRSLEELNLRKCGLLTDKAVETLTRSDNFRSLRRLDLA